MASRDLSLPEKRFPRGLGDDCHHWPCGLAVRAVDLARWFRFECEVPDVVDNPDHGQPRIGAVDAAKLEPLPQSVTVWPVPLRGGAIQDHDLRSVAAILFIEIAAGEQRDLESRKVSGAYQPEVC